MPKPSPQIVINWLQALGFEQPPAGSTIWARAFPAHGLSITVDVDAETINYGPEIQVHRRTTNNLNDLENLVVLECVVSLLATGYAPSCIELEVPFQLGRKAGGYLDILVRRDTTTYLMIECKTTGTAYEKEAKRLTSTPSNQLLSYLQQDRSAEQVVLYSSTVTEGKIKRDYAGFACSGIAGSNTAELFANWDKKTYSSGLFESDPYLIAERTITMGDLRELTSSDSLALFNSFKEILRRHAVSDLPNAFNKLFNLFICKIIDEDKSSTNAVAEFQWGGGESDATVLDRLSMLYERGMRDFLKLDTVDTHEKVAAAMGGIDSLQADTLTRLLAELRQYTNTDFAFVDVYDRRSFDQNASIVRELVRLLQTRRLRYSEKHDFMGLFFERLLHTSMKQESGQFFTPPPIAQFVNESLPIEDIVDKKIAAKYSNFLPYGIDYAAGSGHFLTEFMARVDRVLQSKNAAEFATKTQSRNASQWSEALTWAGEFVYGLELDHRLAKTAKVATFLHGDGDANMLRANGLGHFTKDPDYVAAGPRLHGQSNDRDIQTFDVVVANPPYSVSGFAQALPFGKESFELWSALSDKSDDIESLFVERTKQLLTDGGVAGVILPTSILGNTGVESRARAILLRYFDIVAIVSLGDSVFVATDTPCSILFLKRRPNTEADQVAAQVTTFLQQGTLSPVRGHVSAFDDYAQEQFGVPAVELHTALSDPFTHPELFDDYHWIYASSKKQSVVSDTPLQRRELKTLVHENERAKMEAFFMTRWSKTVVVNAPAMKKEKVRFLGYAFSERRRHEGIRYQSGTSTIETPLFDPSDPNNPAKISTLIKQNYSGSAPSVPPALEPWCAVVPTHELLALEEAPFEFTVRTSSRVQDRFNVATLRLSAAFDLDIGATPTRDRPDYFTGGLPWLKISDLGPHDPDKALEVSTSSEMLTKEGASSRPGMNLAGVGTLLMSFKLTIGRVARAAVPLYTNEAIVSFSPRQPPVPTDPWMTDETLEVLLRRVGPRLLGLGNVGAKKFGRTLNLRTLRQTRVPALTATESAWILAVDQDASKSAEEKSQELESFIWG